MSIVRKLSPFLFTPGLLVIVGVFFSILFLRNLGVFESWELDAYDWYIRSQPRASVPDPPIVLIIINEDDIRSQKHWPLTDATLARMLEILTQAQPCAIGLDIFRDLPVPPGHEELNAVLASNHNIVVVTKAGREASKSVPPPSVLKDTDQYGFGDILVDPDDIVRRGLLFLSDERGKTVYSFALRLALLDLRAKGITPQPDPSNPRYMRLGPTIIRPFKTNTGGYVGADAQGYQFLLDFQDAQESFPSFPLTLLLSGEIGPQVFKDKIVLIGVNAVSVKDSFRTPHSYGRPAGQKKMSGVELHAHMVSQLLRVVLQGSSPITAVSEWQEGVWILCWGAVAGAIGLWTRWRFRQGAVVISLLILGVLSFVYFVISYFAFRIGWWIPLAAPVIAGLISAPVVALVVNPFPPKWTWNPVDWARLAKFVTPRARIIDEIYETVCKNLRLTGANLEGARLEKKIQWAKELYNTLAVYKILYDYERLTYGEEQEIRQPAEVFAARLANCLETSLIYAAALERSFLSPVVIHLHQTRGSVIVGAHALCGFWKGTSPAGGEALITDEKKIRQLIQEQEIIPVETTGFTVKPTNQLIPGKEQISFKEATRKAREQLADTTFTRINFLLDVRRVREDHDYRPIDEEALPFRQVLCTLLLGYRSQRLTFQRRQSGGKVNESRQGCDVGPDCRA